MATIVLLALVTVLYAGYNLLIKVSTGHVPAATTTIILATMALQAAALMVSVVFTGALVLQGGHQFRLTPAAYAWALAAGLCIGAAEVGYFYLFGGIGHGRPVDASVAIPVIVSGTVVITVVVSHFVFRETLAWMQVLGAAMIVAGVLLTFLGPRR